MNAVNVKEHYLPVLLPALQICALLLPKKPWHPPYTSGCVKCKVPCCVQWFLPPTHMSLLCPVVTCGLVEESRADSGNRYLTLLEVLDTEDISGRGSSATLQRLVAQA